MLVVFTGLETPRVVQAAWRYFEDHQGQRHAIGAILEREVALLPKTLAAELYEKNEAVIEFPENSLHPARQVDLAVKLAAVANDENRLLVVATHSPYLIDAWNILVRASQLPHARRREFTRRHHLLDKAFLPPEQLDGYHVPRQGAPRRIVQDDGTLDFELFARVSDALAARYGEVEELLAEEEEYPTEEKTLEVELSDGRTIIVFVKPLPDGSLRATCPGLDVEVEASSVSDALAHLEEALTKPTVSDELEGLPLVGGAE